MARPITWQNVNAPQGALSIEALLRSGRQAGEGFSQMGDVFRTARDEMQQAATGAAVAQIANSTDPLAAAAQAPDTWQFDPLAISQAANAREGQLFNRKVGESNLRQNELAIKDTESRLEDRESQRLIAEEVLKYEPLARAGKEFKVDDANPLWKTPAGFEAIKYLNELRSTAFNQDQERQRTNATVRVANKQAQLFDQELNKQDYLSWVRRIAADPSAALREAAEIDELLLEGAKKFNTSAVHVDEAKRFYATGVAANPPTQEQLNSYVPGTNTTYAEGVRTLTTIKSQAEAERAAILAAPFDPANPEKPDPNRPSLIQLQEFATRGPAFKDGEISFVAQQLSEKAQKMGVPEARERIAEIKAQHRHLTYAQAADLALQSEDRVSKFGFNVGVAPEVVLGARLYKELDKIGGVDGLNRVVSEQVGHVDKILADLPFKAQQLGGAARGGYELPAEIDTWSKQLIDARAKTVAAEKKKAEDDAKRAAELQKAVDSTLRRERY